MLGLGLHASNSASNLFGVSNLFAGGTYGGWWDAGDIATLFQDSAGTIPVTADGDPVGRITDKSGNGKHLIQATAGSRPLYKIDGTTGKPYIHTNDSDAWMSCASFNMSGTDSVSVFTAMQKDSSAAFAVFCELSASTATNTGTFLLSAPNSAAENISFVSKGSAQALATKSSLAVPPLPAIVIGLADISSDYVENRVNDLSAVVTTGTDQGLGNYGNHTLYLFRRGGVSSQFSGRMYELIIRGTSSTETEIAATKAYLKNKSGI